MRSLPVIAAVGALLLLLRPTAAQQAQQRLPRVVSMSAPLYPPLAQQARIQGMVVLRVSTDGKRVVSFDSESGPPLLVRAAKDNVVTWEFQAHPQTNFELRFSYKLSAPPPCEMEFDIGDPKNEWTLLQLPIRVEVNAVIPRICDPAVIEEKN